MELKVFRCGDAIQVPGYIQVSNGSMIIPAAGLQGKIIKQVWNENSIVLPYKETGYTYNQTTDEIDLSSTGGLYDVNVFVYYN